MPPEKRKPVAGKATGFLIVDVLSGKFDVSETIAGNTLDLQAARLRKQFAISLQVARAVAELHFAGGAA